MARLARRPEATLELANLDTLLWFLEEATHQGRDGQREDIVRVHALSPVTDQQFTDYAAAYPAVVAITMLAERTAIELEDAYDRTTDWLKTESGVDEGEIFDDLVIRIQAEPRGRENWWKGLGGTMEL
jgi:hypothetical protein